MQFLIAYKEYLKYISNHLKASSFLDKDKIFKRFILPNFKDFEIEYITKQKLIDWQSELEKYSYKYKSKIRGYLYNFLDFCEYEYDIPNELKKVRNFKKNKYVKPLHNIYSEKEYLRLYNNIVDLEDKCIFNLLYLCSLRKGELCALTWQDWIKDKSKININSDIEILVPGIKVYKCNKVMYVLNAPKTKNSIRSVVLADSSKNLLNSLYKQKSKCSEFSASDFIFGKANDFLKYSTLANKFEKYRKIARLKKIRLHDLRHSGVSLFINRYKDNINMSALHLAYIIAERIGDSVDMVLKTYGHLFVNEQYKLVQSIDI